VSLSHPEPAVLPSRVSSSGFQSSHQSPRSNASRRWPRRYQPDSHLSILPGSVAQSSGSKTTMRGPGQQFVEYFAMRRTDTNSQSCIFVCWAQGNLAKVVDVPFTSEELKDEKKVFERLRENFIWRRGYLRTFFYSAYPEQAKASFQIAVPPSMPPNPNCLDRSIHSVTRMWCKGASLRHYADLRRMNGDRRFWKN
jgi:hypothetical protein